MKRLASKKTPARFSKAAFVLTFQQTFRSCLTLLQTSSYLKEAYLGPNQTFMIGLSKQLIVLSARVHSFSTYSNFFEKLTFLTP